MIDWIIERCLRNRGLVLAFYLLLAAWGVWALYKTPIDAIPDLSENQVIIFTEWLGRGPQEVEDQITYPLVVNLQGLAGVKTIRSSSAFSWSTIYVIFEDSVDLYWARTRILERLALAATFLPAGVVPTLGPDATSLGHVMWYYLEGKGHSLDELRAIQDWYIRYQLTSVPGVSEVGSVGGVVRQYQIDLDPNKMRAHQVSLRDVSGAVQRSNVNVGAKVLEQGGREAVVRGLGLIESVKDIERIVVGHGPNGVPVYVKNVATVQLGPEFRRGVLMNGRGEEVVGGVVVARYGVSTIDVLEGVKRKIQEISPGLPPGVKIVPFYDRTPLIKAAIASLRGTLIEEGIIVAIVVGAFLFHLGSIFVINLALPIAGVLAFLAMYYLGVSSNIMSLGGIAIAIGVMVDSGIVVTENIYRHLSDPQLRGDKTVVEAAIAATKEVGRPIFFSMLVIVLAFVPIFALQAQEGKLFKPLAWTKNLGMLSAAILSISFVPVLASFLLRGKLRPMETNRLTMLAIRLYMPIGRWALRHGRIVVLLAAAILVGSFALTPYIESEFMPPLEEGSALYMPETLPGISLSQVTELLRTQVTTLQAFPEVEMVAGKYGRSETATDATGLGTGDILITWKPREQWRQGMTKDQVFAEMDAALQLPGVTNIWTMPIIDRINMLSTGIPTDVGIKVFGSDLKVLEQLGLEIEAAVKTVPGTSDVFAMRTVGTPYLEIKPKREEIARYGLNVRDVLETIEVAMGGVNVTTTIEGRQRFPVRVRYAREFRESAEGLKRILVPTPAGADIPLSQLAEIRTSTGPGGIAGENGLLVNTVLFNVRGRGLATVVEEAQRAVAERVKLPPGYYVTWSGQYEHQLRARGTLWVVLPLVVFIIFMLLYVTFRSFAVTALVMLAIPFALSGGIAYLYVMGYHLSVAVWVGFIALAGLAAETGVVMVVYLDEALERWSRAGKLTTRPDLQEAILDGAVLRVRPKLMTVGTTVMGLVPIMWSTGVGSDVMKPIATPLIGGMVTSLLLTLIVIPVLYLWVKQRELPLERPQPERVEKEGASVEVPAAAAVVEDGRGSGRL
jgi:Cu(I)/Ag(I) efflux system membrane protein CusA/SilA